MPTAKPAAETLVNGAHAIAPTYGAWLLTGVDPEKDSLNLGSVSAPVSGTGLTPTTNGNGDPAWDFGGAGGLYTIANLPAPVATAGTKQTIIARIYARASTGFRVIYANASNGLFIVGGKVQLYPQTASSGSIPLNTWTTVGVTVDINTDTKYYIDGVLDTTIASGTVGIPSNNVVGIGRDGAGEYFDGIIDYVLVWDDFAMPDANHLSIHNDPFQVFVATASALPNFVHHYKEMGIM